MANWEYKVISSGKGGFASPALMEKFINDLGQDNWEIISFHQPPDNALAFTGLARRSTQKDWTLEDAAKTAARAEADKLRAEFEAKFKAASGVPQPATAEEQAATFLAEEKLGAEGSIRRLRDTSRDDDPDAPEDENGAPPKNDWDKLASEDELPTFFDALRPHMRRNQRGPGMSVGVDFLAKKWRLEESDIKTALVECGMQIPADENAKPVYVEYEGELYWVNINRRGETWINLREKPEPVFRIVQGKRLTEEEAPVTESAPAQQHREQAAPKPQPVHHDAAPAPESRPAASQTAHQSQQREPQTRTLLDKIRGMMRRNRRGNGMSGSFPFLIKALKTTEAGLLEHLAAAGLVLQDESDPKPAFYQEGDFLYWMNKNQRGEIWINARKERRQDGSGPAPESEGPHGQDEGAAEAATSGMGESSSAPAAATDLSSNPPTPTAETAAAEAAPVTAEPVAVASTESASPSGHTLAAVRLLLQPKKRGDGVAALVNDVAQQLGQTPERLVEALAAAGVKEPADAEAKPTFGENAGEIFWLNRNARGELWLNAKASKAAAARKSRPKKKDDESAGE